MKEPCKESVQTWYLDRSAKKREKRGEKGGEEKKEKEKKGSWDRYLWISKMHRKIKFQHIFYFLSFRRWF